MKTKRQLRIVSLIGGLAFVTAAYCFWLMTVPLSYERVYVVVGGFLVSLLLFVVALVIAFVLLMRLRRSHHAPGSPKISN